MCTAGKVDVGRYGCSVPDPSEVFQTRRGGATDPHTRLPGYTCSTMLGVTQVWFAAHHVGHVMKTLRSGRLDELHRRMKRNPHVLDARVCRAVLWWSILGEAMEAAKQAERRRAKRRESRRLVVFLAVSQRRGNNDSSSCSSISGSGSSSTSGEPTCAQQRENSQRSISIQPQPLQQRSEGEERPSSGLIRRSSRTWSLPPLTAEGLSGGGGGGRAPCHGGEVRRRLSVHLDEASILSRIYEFL
eukprot:g6964.t1